MLRIINFNVPFNEEAPLKDIVAKRLKLPPEAVLEVVVVRKAIDARRYRNNPICFVYVLNVTTNLPDKKLLQKLQKDKNIQLVEETAAEQGCTGDALLKERPVVVGLGPAGLLAAWQLAKHGYQPLVLERGQDVDQRTAAIQKFWQAGTLDEQSNVQFGEGGAGTFSDGKLTTRINDSKMQDVIDVFIAAGAPTEIKYLHKPHIGTDKLRGVVKNIRQQIIEMGGEVRFQSTVTDIEIKDGAVKAVIINDTERIACSVLLLGIGHSARDTYKMLHQKGVSMEAKPFAVGVRIEHPQEWIDRSQYGIDAGNPLLPVADYALTFQDKENDRGVYTFCMCPGGQVVAAASEHGHIVTNGMSNYNRDSGIANSALLVTVGPQDFGCDVLAGIAFQRKYEQLAFVCGGGNYCAPVQTVGDFLTGKTGSCDFLTKPTYQPGVIAADLRACLPDFVTNSMAKALPHFGRKLQGFDDVGAVMTGVEMRSSAPCRIVRQRENFISVNVAGLYPMGEGAGYAGGIMSAAVDGLNVATAVIGKYKN